MSAEPYRETGRFLGEGEHRELIDVGLALGGIAELIGNGSTVPEPDQLRAIFSIFAERVDSVLGGELPEVSIEDARTGVVVPLREVPPDAA